MVEASDKSVWPIGLNCELATIDPVAVQEYLSARVSFSRDHDDLDAFLFAVVEVDGQPFASQQYDNGPTGDFTLIGISNGSESGAELPIFLRWSGIPLKAVRWIRPHDVTCPPA